MQIAGSELARDSEVGIARERASYAATWRHPHYERARVFLNRYALAAWRAKPDRLLAVLAAELFRRHCLLLLFGGLGGLGLLLRRLFVNGFR
jgi:hypothetical protein